MSEELTLEYLNERINSRKWENRRLAQVVSQQNNAILEQKNAILEGFGCHQSLKNLNRQRYVIELCWQGRKKTTWNWN